MTRALCATTIFFACTIFMSGCASTLPTAQNTVPTPSATASAGAAATRIETRAARNFTVAGRFAAKRGDQQGSGQFRYSETPELRVLELFTPASTQLARIEATQYAANVSFADGATRTAPTLAALLREFIDVPVTDAQFSAWIQGIPTRGAALSSVDREGRIESFRDAGWSVIVSSRFDGDAAFVRRMRWAFDAGNEAAQNAEVRWVFDEFSTQ